MSPNASILLESRIEARAQEIARFVRLGWTIEKAVDNFRQFSRFGQDINNRIILRARKILGLS